MVKFVAVFLAGSLIGPKSYAGDSNAIELKDLGFDSTITKPDTELQRTLEDRRYYLRQHQIWGLVAAGSLILAAMSGGEGDLPPEHPFVAGLAVASYSAAAYTAWKAPELPHGKESGGTKWHRRLVWIHLPAMIAAPILGYIAAKKVDRGERLDGAEKYHKDAALIAAGSVALAALTVSFEF